MSKARFAAACFAAACVSVTAPLRFERRLQPLLVESLYRGPPAFSLRHTLRFERRLQPLLAESLYRSTSLSKKKKPLGPYRRPISWVLGES